MSKLISLTLDLGREEKDEGLWELLRGLSEEQRVDVIKTALDMYMATFVQKSKTQNSWSLEDLFVATTLGAAPESSPESSLESSLVFSPEFSPESSLKSKAATGENAVERQASEKAESVSPLSQLFELIGEENDQDVLEFFRTPSGATSTQPSDSGEVSSPDDEEAQVRKSEMATVDKVKDSMVAFATPRDDQGNNNKGLDYILNQVIGREEDPEVLSFFRGQAPS
ncbi:hypothetical protein AAC978_09860 [Desulfitobacterium sp. THU1]|uniref:hypothetical protein n=1 Tax=Desulfitobacterium sp. THU1 TaxID=3138072 RepID=UPI00311F4EE4